MSMNTPTQNDTYGAIFSIAIKHVSNPCLTSIVKPNRWEFRIGKNETGSSFIFKCRADCGSPYLNVELRLPSQHLALATSREFSLDNLVEALEAFSCSRYYMVAELLGIADCYIHPGNFCCNEMRHNAMDESIVPKVNKLCLGVFLINNCPWCGKLITSINVKEIGNETDKEFDALKSLFAATKPNGEE